MPTAIRSGILVAPTTNASRHSGHRKAMSMRLRDENGCLIFFIAFPWLFIGIGRLNRDDHGNPIPMILFGSVFVLIALIVAFKPRS